MLISLIIFALAILFLYLFVLRFPVVRIGRNSFDTFYFSPLVAAILMISLRQVPISVVLNDAFDIRSPVNPLKILVLFITITFPCVVLDELGVFKSFSTWVLSKVKGSQIALFVCVYLLCAVLTIFTSNDIVILTLTPFICNFSKSSKINPLPYLVAEFASANTYSMMLIVGNPTNIYLASNANIDFVNYFRTMFLPTILTGMVQLLLLLIIFKNLLKKNITYKINVESLRVKTLSLISLLHLFVMILFFALASYLKIQMYIVSLICFISLFLILFAFGLKNKGSGDFLKSSLKRLPYSLVPFVLSMFIVVEALGYSGVTLKIANILNSSKNLIYSYGLSSFVLSNVLNNIPASILFSNLCNTLKGGDFYLGVYPSIIASNLGAFFTPLGALAGIMFTKLSRLYGVRMGFVDFVKYLAPLSIVSLLFCLFAFSLF